MLVHLTPASGKANPHRRSSWVFYRVEIEVRG
jgi:hypothetical protein